MCWFGCRKRTVTGVRRRFAGAQTVRASIRILDLLTWRAGSDPLVQIWNYFLRKHHENNIRIYFLGYCGGATDSCDYPGAGRPGRAGVLGFFIQASAE
jgi:hypothetical protein